ncbi:MAG: hypothetical protein GTN92_21540, partial [Pseudomonas stutzeri]|nr:hypothetical protein [Stutzerimonas stutzeri]
VAHATNLEDLKADVNAQLDQMRASMTAFREKETERIRRSEDLSVELHGKLEAMQAETAQLRDQLEENRNRMMVDSGTGVHSRFAYEEHLQHEYMEWRSTQAPLSL